MIESYRYVLEVSSIAKLKGNFFAVVSKYLNAMLFVELIFCQRFVLRSSNIVACLFRLLRLYVGSWFGSGSRDHVETIYLMQLKTVVVRYKLEEFVS